MYGSRQSPIEFSSKNLVNIVIFRLQFSLTLDSDRHLDPFTSFTWGHSVSLSQSRALEIFHILIKNTRKGTGGSGVGHVNWDLSGWDHLLLVKCDVGRGHLSLHKLLESDLYLSNVVNFLSIKYESFIMSLVQNSVYAVLLRELFEKDLDWHGLLPELLVGHQLELLSVEHKAEIVPIGLLDGELSLGGLALVTSYSDVILL